MVFRKLKKLNLPTLLLSQLSKAKKTTSSKSDFGTRKVLKSLLNILPDDEIFNNNNIFIFCETFLQKPWNIDGFYAIHALAKSGTERRP